MLHAVYRAAPSGTTIMPVVASEFESVGGEKMVVSVFESLKTAFETLEEEARDDVTLENVEMDAGYCSTQPQDNPGSRAAPIEGADEYCALSRPRLREDTVV